MTSLLRASGGRGLFGFVTQSLTRSAIFLFGAITLITVSCSGYDYFLIREESSMDIELQEKMQKSTVEVMQLISLLGDVRYDVVQVQQYLSDYAATRGLDGQDDGLKSAEEYNGKLKKDIEGAKSAARALGAADVVDALENVGNFFPDYYAKGLTMAKVYAAKGPGEGNKLMVGFDQLSDKLQEELAGTAKSVEAARARYQAQPEQFTGEIDATRRRTALIALVNICVVFLTCVLGVVICYRRAIQPLSWITFTFKELVRGVTNYEVYEAGRRDEIGELGRTYSEFREIAKERRAATIRAEENKALADAEREKGEVERAAVAATQSQIIKLLSGGLSKIAMRDLSFLIQEDVAPTYAGLKRDYNAAVENLRDAIGAVADGVEAFAAATREIGTAAGDLSRRTEQQAASLEETTAALQEIFTSVKQNAEGAGHAREIVATAEAEAEKSSSIAQEAIGAMNRIEKSSADIGQIIGVIDEIAFQTNLLALNAGVEAARAGDAGKGFAVVASEVRNLAQRSAEAAKQIKQLIFASAEEVGEGVKCVTEARNAMQRIVSMVVEINGVVSQTAQAAAEQSNSIQQINVALQQMDKDTQKNAAMVEETTAATQSLRHEASKVVHAVENFSFGAAARNKAPRRAAVARGGAEFSTAATARKLQPKEDEWAEF